MTIVCSLRNHPQFGDGKIIILDVKSRSDIQDGGCPGMTELIVVTDIHGQVYEVYDWIDMELNAFRIDRSPVL